MVLVDTKTLHSIQYYSGGSIISLLRINAISINQELNKKEIDTDYLADKINAISTFLRFLDNYYRELR